MSFYSDASLVLVPSGVKDSKVYSIKPTDGSGDLTFTRNSNATRVNADGLVEKVRTNLLTYSNDFSNANWIKDNGATVTAGQSGYDGSSNAWKLEAPTAGASRDIYQINSASAPLTFSLYAKAGTTDWIRINLSGIGNQYFNLANGTAGSGSGIPYSITAAGNGYYRISISGLTGSITSVYIFLAAGDVDINVSAGDNVYIQNAQLEATDFGPTPYIATTSAAVSVGPTANVPRLNYSNGCPSLLLEPQTTSLCLWSEQLDQWTTSGTGTVTKNTDISPDGYQNADTLNDTDSGGYYRIEQNITTTVGQKYTASVFIKKASAPLTHWPGVQWDTTYRYFIFNNYTGTYSLAGGTSDYEGVSVEDFGNYWRVSLTTTAGATSERFAIWPALSSDGASIAVAPTGSNVFWGANVTQTSYLQSYVPTLGASVTRLADAAYKTGISSLIGQTEGTMFAEVDLRSTSSTKRILYLSDGTTNNEIRITSNSINVGDIQYAVRVAGTLEVNFFTPTNVYTNGVFKIAAAYKANDFVIYINGVQVGTDTSGGVPTCGRIDVGSQLGTSSFLDDRINQALLFKTRLTNAQLAELTTL